jgi:signal transduction histidine kinase
MTRGRIARGQHRPGSRPAVGGRPRPARPGRQRSIRSTITILLVLPLISLIALWAYAAASTVGGAIAKRNADALNKDVGGPLQVLGEQLAAERADTFAWQSARGRMPAAPLAAQRKKTDAAVAAFRAGVAAGAGLEPAVAKPVAATVLTQLSGLGTIREGVDAGRIAPLAAFGDYNAVADAPHSFIIALTNPDESIPLLLQSQAGLEEAEAVDEVAREAALVGGVLAAGGVMSTAEHQAFAQAVDDQRLYEQLGNSPQDWQQSPNPYPPLFASRPFQTFRTMEDRIAGARPGSRIPVSPAAWQASVGALVTAFVGTETAARVELTKGEAHAGDDILLRLFFVGGVGLAAVLISSLLLLRFGNRITRELTQLRGAARTLARERLPSVVTRLRAGVDVDVDAEAPPLVLRTRTREVTETADAFSAVQRTAVEAAVQQAELRKGVSNVFRSLARRNQSLLQRQLKMLDEMERGTEDPEALAQLFKVDHLTTRMRRQAEGLIILSGAPLGRGWRQPVPIVEVLRGAIGEIEDYARVDLVTDSPDFIHGGAVADVTHLLAELIENAASYSPPTTRVRVTGGRVAGGYAIEVDDQGLGIPAGVLAGLNDRLANPPEFDLADSDQLGLFVVSRLAARHGIKVSLQVSAYSGTRAVVVLSPALIATEEQAAVLARPRPGLAALDMAGARPTSEGAVALGFSAAGTVHFDQPAGLPRRTPMANLAPQLRDGGPASPGGPGGKASAASVRSPEQARALLTSVQRGWLSGRSAADMSDITDRGVNSPNGSKGPGYDGSGR